MGDISEVDGRGFLNSVARLPCKRNDITHTYTRKHGRSKIETGSSRSTKDQELETCKRNSKGTTHDVKPRHVLAPDTPDIISRKQKKQKLQDVSCEPHRVEYGRVSAVEIKQSTYECPHSKKKTCCRSLDLDMPNCKRKDGNDLMFLETDVSYTDLNIDDNSVSKSSVLLSRVQEHDPNMTEKVSDAKDYGFPRILLVYQRRKQVKSQVKKKAKTSSSSSPKELKGPNERETQTLAKPVLRISKHPNIKKRIMTYIDDIFIQKPDSECNGKSDKEQRERQKSVQESLHRQIQLFMSCMDYVQGERKFSQWKGSVMDSIVGAYLSQNVNDSLSSFAFMSLAAKFPGEAVSHVEASSSKMRNDKEKKKNAGCSKNVQKGKAAKKFRYSKTRNTRKQRITKKHDAELLNVLKDYCSKYHSKNKMIETLDSINWESVRKAKVGEISKAIQIRGMSKNLSGRIKDCLDHLVETFKSTDMEWLRDVPSDTAKKYLMSINGLGLKTVECIRLLTLRQKAFPIDRNAGRVAVRLGWVPLKQLPEEQEFHQIETYPKSDLIQMYLWQHLSQLEWSIQYELHCQMITFGKVFCTQRKPNCRECPMKAECKYFNSFQASAAEPGTDIEDYGLIKPKHRAEHQVYVLPDGHDLLIELETRELDDPCPYLLAVWTPESLEKDESIPEEDAVYGTLLIPARTATRGMFPLNGTFFQANEVFADDKSSEAPIKVPRTSLTNLPTTSLYCGNSMSPICRGMKSAEIQECFKREFACFRGFDRETREPKPLPARFHIQASKAGKTMKNIK